MKTLIPPLVPLAIALLPLVAASCSKKSEAASAEEDVYVDKDMLAIYLSDPRDTRDKDAPSTPEKVALGKALFSEKALSKAGDVSCASCHDPARQYADPGNAKSKGSGGVEAKRNTPSLVNVGKHALYLYDFRAPTLEGAIAMHALEPSTFGLADEAALAKKLEGAAAVQDAFKKAYPGDAAVSAKNAADALGAFVRTLTGKTRFDEYLDGKDDALTAKEKTGLKLFTDAYSCKTCHITRLVGGNMMNKFGLEKVYESADQGRYEVTKNDAEKHVYKVQSLVNVTRTGPYFHDASAKTLVDAVTTMITHQSKREPKADEVAAIVAFLGALETK